MCDFVLAPTCPLGQYWTAARRDEADVASPFQWTLSGGGVMPMTYTNWYPGSPNNYGGLNEACMYTGVGVGGVYQWDDAPCSYTFCGVCEIDMS